jgi:aspartate 1-decarboxylase
MLIHVVKSKIHRVKVTGADLNYIGSITIDEDLMDAANIVQGEKIQVVNNNGAAAHKVNIGDVLILITYAMMSMDEAKTHKPYLVFPDEATNLLK